MSNKIVVDLGFAKLVAEDCTNEPYKQIAIYLERDSNTQQDIVLVGTDESETDDGEVQVLVWTNKNDEDYSDKFIVGLTELED